MKKNKKYYIGFGISFFIFLLLGFLLYFILGYDDSKKIDKEKIDLQSHIEEYEVANNVDGCSNEEYSKYLEEASRITVEQGVGVNTYEGYSNFVIGEEDNNEIFEVEYEIISADLKNISNNLYIEVNGDEQSEKINDGILKINGEEDILTINDVLVYVKEGTCKNALVRRMKIELPYENPLYFNTICENNNSINCVRYLYDATVSTEDRKLEIKQNLNNKIDYKFVLVIVGILYLICNLLIIIIILIKNKKRKKKLGEFGEL